MEGNMSTVYVIQESPGKNIVGASDYGSIFVMLPKDSQVMFEPDSFIREISEKMKDFSDDDYLLLIGDPTSIGIACSIAAKWNNHKYNVLKWDRQEKKYFPIHIDLEGGE
jgi:hypothetical protein